MGRLERCHVWCLRRWLGTETSERLVTREVHVAGSVSTAVVARGCVLVLCEVLDVYVPISCLFLSFYVCISGLRN